jgi:hypothetical protein
MGMKSMSVAHLRSEDEPDITSPTSCLEFSADGAIGDEMSKAWAGARLAIVRLSRRIIRRQMSTRR